jgi:hypothetical protein
VQHLLAFGVLFDEDQVENDHRRISDLKDSEIFALVK